MNYERDYELAEAIPIAQKVLDDIGINYFIRTYSTERTAFSSISVNEIKQSDTEIVSSGKGIGEQAVASGLFEAIEHYYYTNDITIDSKLLTVDELLNQDEALMEVLPIKLLSGRIDKVMCIKIKSLYSDKKIWYPAFLIFDHEVIGDTVPTFIRKYLSNNGLAVGVTRSEALIHGINEVIERETLSKHFQDIFIDRCSQTVYKLDISSLPKDIFEKIRDIENTIGSAVTIIDITRYDGFYTYYAFVKYRLLPLKGSGTSRFRKYALLRALSELYQAFAMFDEEDEKMDERALKNFEDIPQYKNLLLANYSITDFTTVCFIEEDEPKVNCDELLDSMLYILSKNRFSVFEYRVQTHPKIYCTRVIILEADNFQLANHGIRVIPNGQRR